MALMQISSPHATGTNRTQKVMLTVCLATLPGLLAMVWFLGPGPLINVLLAGLYAMLWEALVLYLRGKSVGFFLRDGSALLTGILLGLALPPYCPWWLLLVGTGFAIVIAKQLYGGLGQNPFNPAMAGYVVLLISFPLHMSQWPLPEPLMTDGQHLPGIAQTLAQVFGTGPDMDGFTGATPLDLFRQNTGLMIDELYQQAPQFSQAQWAGAGFEWINLGFLVGGLVLLQQRMFTWHTPVGMLAALALLSALFYDGGSAHSAGSPLFHWFSGATMLGAFFIATDPVTACTSTRGRLIFGAGIGTLVFCIRTWGNYPDAIAFSVLLMNFAAPFIDYYTTPRSYGHARARNAREKSE